MSESGNYEDMDPDQLQPEETLEDRGVDDVLDEGYSPPEREPRSIQHFDDDETLDERLADEEPEVWQQPTSDELTEADEESAEVGDDRAGRLMAPDEGAHQDEEKDLVAHDEGIAGSGASAEEAAVHVVDDE